MVEPLATMQKREKKAIRDLPFFPEFVTGKFYAALGIRWPQCWMLFDIPNGLLVDSAIGDVDILMGNLEIRRDGLRVPSVDHLVGIEAKCAKSDFSRSDKSPGNPFSLDRPVVRKSDNSSGSLRRIRGKLGNLGRLGFDAVGLLDILPTTPLKATGIDGQDWIAAADANLRTIKEAESILRARLPDESPFWHFSWGVGAIAEKHEHKSGSSSIEIQKKPNLNLNDLFGTERLKNRPILQKSMAGIFSRLPASPLITPLWDLDASGKFQALPFH